MVLLIDQSKENTADCIGLRTLHGNQTLAKIGKNSHKTAITSVACDISMQSLVLRQAFSYQRIHL